MKKYFQMQFFTLCHQILPILTIGANIGSCPRTTLPLPHGLFHFAPLSRLATPRWALAIVFLFLIICGHFDHGCLESSAGSHCVYLQRRGKTHEMFIPDQS